MTDLPVSEGLGRRRWEACGRKVGDGTNGKRNDSCRADAGEDGTAIRNAAA
jgi:hypothetical protein